MKSWYFGVGLLFLSICMPVNGFCYVEYPQAKGDLVYRDSEGFIYGRDGDYCLPPWNANAIENPGHVGIYIGGIQVIHAFGWIGAGTEVKVTALLPEEIEGVETFYRDIDGNILGFPMGAKAHRLLLNNPKADVLRKNIVTLALDQRGEEYDALLDDQKGPGSGDWICSGFVEKIYESCAGQTLLIYHEQEEGYNYGDEDLYVGGLNITRDGYECHDPDILCYFQTNVEFSQIKGQIAFGRTFRTGEELPHKFIFFPYTQFLQPTLTDSFALPDFYLLSGTLTDANGNPARGYIYAYETSGANLGNRIYSSDGTYEMALFPGTYCVYAAQVYNSYPGGCYYLRTSDEILTINANATLNITVPSYELYHLTGKVSNANGEGLPDISIRAHNNNGLCQSYTTTNNDGTYDALVIPGTYRLRFIPPADSGFLQKYLYNIPIYNNYYQEVSLDSQVQYTLSGTLTDANGNPLQGGVYANQISSPFHYGSDYSSDGTYEMDLFLGTYRVFARTYNYYAGSYTYINTAYQNLIINTDTTFNIVAPSYDLFSLTGKVTDISNVAQTNVNIYAYNNSGICQGNVRTDDSGDYSLKLIPGTYRLRIIAPPATYPPFEIKNLQISDDSVRNIRLSLEYTILEEAIAQLLANLELSLDVFNIINQEETLNYNMITLQKV